MTKKMFKSALFSAVASLGIGAFAATSGTALAGEFEIASGVTIAYANPGGTITVFHPGALNQCGTNHSIVHADNPLKDDLYKMFLAAVISGRMVTIYGMPGQCDVDRHQVISHAGIHAVTP
jgi:uncharacterized membrane protein